MSESPKEREPITPEVSLRSIEAVLGTLDHSKAVDDDVLAEHVAARVNAVVAELRSLRKDRERLRELERLAMAAKDNWLVINADCDEGGLWEVAPNGKERFHGKSLNEAIDAAIKEQGNAG